MANRPDESLYRAVLEDYKETKSVAKTSANLKVSQVKVRKVLITEGLWHSKTSDAVQEYLAQGKKTDEIAQLLKTTVKAVQQYLPYTRGIYKGDFQSSDAVRSAEYRKRKKSSAEENDEKKAAAKGALKSAAKKAAKAAEPKKAAAKAETKKTQKQKKTVEWPADIPGDFLRLHMELVEKDSVIRSRKSWAISESKQALEYKRRDKEEMDRVLHSYGEVKHGAHISRDIAVTDELTLEELHELIQKAFNWQDEQEHSFQVTEDSFAKIISNRAGNWAELCGILFSFDQLPQIRKKGPFFKVEYSEQEDGSLRAESAKPVDRMMTVTLDEKDRMRGIVKKEVVPFAQAPVQAIYAVCDVDPSVLEEHLTIQEILSFHRSEDGQSADELIYLYDEADEWCVRITGSIGCADLIADERITPDHFTTATGQLKENIKASCLALDGLSVLEEVGGLDGYVRLLRGIHPEEEKAYWEKRIKEENIPESEKADFIPGNWGYDEPDTYDWAKGLGWSRELPDVKTILN